MPVGLVPHPGGMRDNSPMFQHWGEQGKWWPVPKGRLRDRAPFQPSLRDSMISAALLRGDMKAVLSALRRGLEGPEHAAFVAKPA